MVSSISRMLDALVLVLVGWGGRGRRSDWSVVDVPVPGGI